MLTNSWASKRGPCYAYRYGAGLGGLLFIPYVVLGLIYLADFLTAGAFKRGGDTFYFYFYRFMGWLTLARLYRPLYYAVISNRWGKRMVLAIVPYLLLIVLLPRTTVDPLPYLDREEFLTNSNMKMIHRETHYADAEGFRASNSSIYLDSDLITEKVLRVHVPLQERYTAELEHMAENDLAESDADSEVEETLTTADRRPYLNAADSLAQLEKRREVRRRKSEARNRRIGENVGRWLSGGLPLSSLDDNADSLLISRFLRIMDLRLDSTYATPSNVLLHVPYTGSPISELVAYFPLEDVDPGMHRVEFREFRLSTRGDDKGNIDLSRTYWVPFFYGPE